MVKADVGVCPLCADNDRQSAKRETTLSAMSGHRALLPTPNEGSLLLNFYCISAGLDMKRFAIAIALFGGIWFAVTVPAEAAPCLIVTLTGTQSGPSVFNGQAGAGTLLRYGDDSNDCAAMKLQFDAGRGTNMRLSQIDVTPVQLNAIFFTHMHGDHTEGFADIMMLRWYLKGSKIEPRTLCSAPVTVQHRVEQTQTFNSNNESRTVKHNDFSP
jgi:hypothetical protein